MAVPGQMALSEAMPKADAAAAEFEAAVREHARFVYKIAYAALRNHHDAEDAVQETFVRLFRHRHEWPEIRNPRAWLARTAWRVAADRKRRPPEISLDAAAQAVLVLRAQGAAPDEIAAKREVSALLAHLIQALPLDLRDAVTLSTVNDLSSPEIGELLGIPEGSVRERLWRARRILREKLMATIERKHGPEGS